MNNGIQVYDIYSYYYTPFWRTPWFIALLIAASLILCGMLVYWWMKKRRVEQVSEIDNILYFIEHLSVNEHQYKAFYFDVTRQLKRYLTLAFGIDLAGKTDLEVIKAMQSTGVPPELIPLIEAVFAGPQAIKYAHQQARLNQMIEDKKHCITIIKCTKDQAGA